MTTIDEFAAEYIYENMLKPAEVAQLMRVDARTVNHWSKTGRLACVKTMGGHRRYPEVCVRAAMRGDLETARTLPATLHKQEADYLENAGVID